MRWRDGFDGRVWGGLVVECRECMTHVGWVDLSPQKVMHVMNFAGICASHHFVDLGEHCEELSVG